MATKGRAKGGSNAGTGRAIKKKSTKQIRLPQVPESHQTGIRISPGPQFRFTPAQRDEFLKTFPFDREKLRKFFTATEGHIRGYRFGKKSEKITQLPSDRRGELLKIRNDAHALLVTIAAMNHALSTYSPKYDALAALVSMCDPARVDFEDKITRRTEKDLRAFIKAIDKALALDPRKIAAKVSKTDLLTADARTKRAWATLVAQSMVLGSIDVRLGPRPKAAERALIRNILHSYYEQFGNIRNYSPKAPLHAFILKAFECASPEYMTTDAKSHASLIREEAATFKAIYAGKSGR